MFWWIDFLKIFLWIVQGRKAAQEDLESTESKAKETYSLRKRSEKGTRKQGNKPKTGRKHKRTEEAMHPDPFPSSQGKSQLQQSQSHQLTNREKDRSGTRILQTNSSSKRDPVGDLLHDRLTSNAMETSKHGQQQQQQPMSSSVPSSSFSSFSSSSISHPHSPSSTCLSHTGESTCRFKKEASQFSTCKLCLHNRTNIMQISVYKNKSKNFDLMWPCVTLSLTWQFYASNCQLITWMLINS